MTESAIYRSPVRPVEERVADLLERMTLDEKIAQLGAVWAGSLLEGEEFSTAKAAPVLAHGTGHVTRIAASTVLGPVETARVVNAVQRFLLEETRLGIPAIVHEESCAGYTARGATQFPQAIGLASTWEPELAREVGAVIRSQMRAVGALQTLAPVLDVARDPRWGRCEETFGEDPYLTSRMGVAYVRGVQGETLRRGVAATAKHYMGYGASEGGLNWAPCQLPRRELLERILPPFAAAVREAGLASVMNGYHEIDGVPCGASKYLLDELLRGELGFEGVVVADYYTVICLHSYHRIAADKSEAGARALEAGLDVELPVIDCYGDPLKQAIESGRVAVALVDRSVARVLRMKFELGLFEEPTVDADAAAGVFDTPPQRQLARRVARKSMVLLKNQGDLLPLDPKLRKLAVIGPNADSVRNMQGDYHYPAHVEMVFGAVRDADAGDPEQDAGALAPGQRAESVDLRECFTPASSVLEGIREEVSETTEIEVARGCGLTDASTEGFAEAVAVARGADAAVVVVGGRSGLIRGCTSGEAMDSADIALSGVQAELVRAVAETGTPTVVVLINGRPLALSNIADCTSALVEAWLPGEEGGRAVAEILFGRESPAGRLPVTLPRATGQLPLYYNHKPSGARSQFYGDYWDLPCSPLFPFGHGLSYTRFDYGDLRLSSRTPSASDILEISLQVTNCGERAGDEVVQLYVRDPVASVTRPVKELKGFARIHLEPDQSRRVTFHVDLGQLAFYDRDMCYVVEPGELWIGVGGSSEDLRLEDTVEITGERRQLRSAEVAPTRVEVS
jgi:beta-glucosidase